MLPSMFTVCACRDDVQHRDATTHGAPLPDETINLDAYMRVPAPSGRFELSCNVPSPRLTWNGLSLRMQISVGLHLTMVHATFVTTIPSSPLSPRTTFSTTRTDVDNAPSGPPTANRDMLAYALSLGENFLDGRVDTLHIVL